MKIARILILSFCYLICGCQTFKFVLDEQAIVDEIVKIRSKSPLGDIPNDKWPELIEEIDAIRVYNHYANVAIVLSEDENTESGIYVYQKISSYLPKENFGGWKFEKIGTDIWKYTHEKAGEPVAGGDATR